MTELMLHIGTRKTGTSFLQQVLMDNTDTLRQAGWWQPDFIDQLNKYPLVLPFTDDRKSPDHHAFGAMDQAGAQALAVSLGEQIQSRLEPSQRWIISSESAGSRVVSDESVGAFLDYLAEYFTKITAVVYLRRQDFLVPSMYSQHVKEGVASGLSWTYCERRMVQLEHGELCQRWMRRLGPDNVRVRPYLEAYKANSKLLLDDFIATVGLPPDLGTRQPTGKRVNAGLSVEAAAFLLAINAALRTEAAQAGMPRWQMRHLFLGVMAPILGELAPGPSIKIKPTLGDQIRSYFRTQNEQLVSTLGDNAEWRTWLDQPAGDATDPRDLQPMLSQIANGRVAELLVDLAGADEFFTARRIASILSRLADPAGPVVVDLRAPDAHPMRPTKSAVQRALRRLPRQRG
ncbi:MAG: hypothetical protein WCP28_04140 [Actinomycetes bacterium]